MSPPLPGQGDGTAMVNKVRRRPLGNRASRLTPNVNNGMRRIWIDHLLVEEPAALARSRWEMDEETALGSVGLDLLRCLDHRQEAAQDRTGRPSGRHLLSPRHHPRGQGLGRLRERTGQDFVTKRGRSEGGVLLPQSLWTPQSEKNRSKKEFLARSSAIATTTRGKAIASPPAHDMRQARPWPVRHDQLGIQNPWSQITGKNWLLPRKLEPGLGVLVCTGAPRHEGKRV